MFKIKLGATVKDKVTGFTGVVIGRTEWLSGCLRYEVQAKVDKEGKYPSIQSIDEEVLQVLKKAPVVPMRRAGGPKPQPTRPSVKR